MRWGRVVVVKDALLNAVDTVGLTEKESSEARLEGGEGVRHAGIEETILGRRNIQGKGRACSLN